MKTFLNIGISLLILIVSPVIGYGEIACDPKVLYQADEKFFVSLPGYQVTPIKETNLNFFGKIHNKERTYKNASAKVRVRMFWGENLIPNWQGFTLNLLEISKNELKDGEIDGIKVKFYENGEKKVIVVPILEETSRGFLILFSSKDLSLEALKNFVSQFPIKTLCSNPELSK